MQDDNRMDESFIERAWTNMNIMLDQEMPAREKKKRRFERFRHQSRQMVFRSFPRKIEFRKKILFFPTW